MGSDILVNRLTVAFGEGSDAAAVKNVTTRFLSGQVTGLIGESGSGKSVLGMSILRLLPSSARLSGAIEFNGENLLSLSAQMPGLRQAGEAGRRPDLRGMQAEAEIRAPAALYEMRQAAGGQPTGILRGFRA